MTLDLSAYKPIADTVTDASSISSAFTTLETWGNALPTSTLPAGVFAPYGGAAAPSGWFVCDGSAVSRVTYAALFTAISTNYGVGDGSTTFNLPDFRGRVPVGYAASGGHTDVSTLGNNDGVALSHRRSKHRHTTSASSTVKVRGPNTSGGADPTSVGAANIGTPDQTNPVTVTVSVGNDTTNDPLDSAAYLVANWIVKT